MTPYGATWRHRFWLIWAVLLLVGAGETQAQDMVELRGRVIDSITGAPVADAVVRVPLAGKYTLTSTSGEFAVTVARGFHTIVILQPGYGERTVRLHAQPDLFHVIRLVPQPFQLDPLVVTDERRTERVMNAAATVRAMDMVRDRFSAGPPGPPVFWKSWDRDAILAAGIADPVAFLRRGPPHLSIRKCSGANQSADRLCVGVPFGNLGPPGFRGNSGVWIPRMTNSERLRAGGRARLQPASTRTPRVFLDDRLVAGFEALETISMSAVYRVETYGYRGEYGVRFYTEGYLRLIAGGLITADTRVVPETFEQRRRN